MFGKRKWNWIALIVLIAWTYYMFTNREHFVQEHLTNNNPTLVSLQQGLDTTNANLSALQTKVNNFVQQGQAQASQAAAAKASLEAIPMGSNTVIPTSS